MLSKEINHSELSNKELEIQNLKFSLEQFKTSNDQNKMQINSLREENQTFKTRINELEVTLKFNSIT
jgi:hypothetical protein